MVGRTHLQVVSLYCEGFREVIQWLLPGTGNVCDPFLLQQKGGDEKSCKQSTSLSSRFCRRGNTLLLSGPPACPMKGCSKGFSPSNLPGIP